MSKEPETPLDTKDEDSPPNLIRRQLGVGLLAVLGGSLGVVKTAQAFEPGSAGNFNAASRVLKSYGVTVSGDTSRGHDSVNFQIVPLSGTEYTQTAGMLNRLGQMDPCFRTSVFDDDVSFTHFHDGAIIPCVKTAVEGHSLATHELFDADQGGIDPCYKVESEMLEGGHIGYITATHFHPNGEGGIDPCFRTTLEGHEFATFELFNAGGRGVDSPDFTVATQMLDGGVLGAVDVSIDNLHLSFSLRVGDKTYHLVAGELLLTPSSAS